MNPPTLQSLQERINILEEALDDQIAANIAFQMQVNQREIDNQQILLKIMKGINLLDPKLFPSIKDFKLDYPEETTQATFEA